ncbi:Tetracycline resistance protein, class C [Corynebacterium striatum]|nr:Tetracycline resistance protein, class C [Corynebacterium striatum]
MKSNNALIVILGTVTLDAVGIGLVMPVLPGLLRDIVHSDSIASHYGVLLPVMTSELHLDLFRTLGCRRAFFIGENRSNLSRQSSHVVVNDPPFKNSKQH